MDRPPAPRPHMWRMYIRTLLPDATAEPLPLAAPQSERRRTLPRRRGVDRVGRLRRPGTHIV
jgi:hypothetical protein